MVRGQTEYDYTHGEEPGLTDADVVAAWIVALVSAAVALLVF